MSTVEPFLHVMSGKGRPAAVSGMEMSPNSCTVYSAIGCGSSMDGDTVMCVHVCFKTSLNNVRVYNIVVFPN